MKLTRMEKVGDADHYVLTDDDGRDHKVIVSNAEKTVDPKGALHHAVSRVLAREGLGSTRRDRYTEVVLQPNRSAG